MSSFKNIKIENNKDSAIVIGKKNKVIFNKEDSNLSSQNISSDKEVWEKVIYEIKNLQTEVRSLPDEEEKVRDRELVPLVSEFKSEALEIQEVPEKEKTKFLDTLGKITDISSKSALVFEKIKPYYDRIIELITIGS
ncbi:hypothetical protein [Priestia aryabhattai]|uniref:hypothetical protein n=1 Tax=Priestia aryabhattai TaxID=412384 RepID=UPI001C8D4C1B|nr:hypothetical protein [Priestia aryabhattai]MBY0062366.1 hypothetical protein [Priestia aryabhattai]